MNVNPSRQNSMFARIDPHDLPRPLRSHKGWIALNVISAFLICMLMIYLGILRTNFGRDTISSRAKLSSLRNDVRDLESRRASLTSYSSIENAAQSMGMVMPKQAFGSLNVAVPRNSVPSTWLKDSFSSDFSIGSEGLYIAQRVGGQP